MSGMWGASAGRRFLVVASLMGLAGCAAPSSQSASSDGTFLSNLSAAIMSQGAHAAAAVTGDECNVLASLLRNGRSFCEAPTPDTRTATRGRNGSVILTLKAPAETPKTAALDPYMLGFAPVDRRLAADFTLEIARPTSETVDAPMLSFGMLSANYGPSFAYELKLRPATDDKKVASAAAAFNAQ